MWCAEGVPQVRLLGSGWRRFGLLDALRSLPDISLDTTENRVDLVKWQKPGEAAPVRKLEGENDGAAVFQ